MEIEPYGPTMDAFVNGTGLLDCPGFQLLLHTYVRTYSSVTPV